MAKDVVTKCECPIAGYCSRHGVDKTSLLHRKCQTDPAFWEAWEKGKGPLQEKKHSAARGGPPVHKQGSGPGTELKKELAKLGFSTASGCGCSSKSNKMDKWGAEKCREKIEEITDWLVDAAKKNSWLTRIAVSAPIVGDVARYEIKQMILRAIERAESSSQGAAAS